jgi:ribosome-binding factor A
MSQFRQDRVNEQLTEVLSEILRDIKDPRVSSVFISVTGVDCTADFKFAKIYYSVLGDYDEKELIAGLKSATGFVRGQIAQRVNLRITPELKFIRDESIKKGDEINRLLKSVLNNPAENGEKN